MNVKVTSELRQPIYYCNSFSLDGLDCYKKTVWQSESALEGCVDLIMKLELGVNECMLLRIPS